MKGMQQNFALRCSLIYLKMDVLLTPALHIQDGSHNNHNNPTLIGQNNFVVPEPLESKWLIQVI